MFGEVDYDPTCKYSSIPMEEQLDALSSLIHEGKVSANLVLEIMFL